MEARLDPNMDPTPARRTVRTCIGCGLRDDKAAMLRLSIVDGLVGFRSAGAPGRGGHLHPRPRCIGAAPRGLARAFRRDVRAGVIDLRRSLVQACEQRMVELIVSARHRGVLAVDPDEATAALGRGAPLAVVPVDAYDESLGEALRAELGRAVASGRAIAWSTKKELAALIGEDSVAACVVCHDRIASELRWLRAAADAGKTTAREGAECSKFPEAR